MTPDRAAHIADRAMRALVADFAIITSDGDGPSWMAGFDTGLALAANRPELARDVLEALRIDAGLAEDAIARGGIAYDEAAEHVIRAFPEYAASPERVQ